MGIIWLVAAGLIVWLIVYLARGKQNQVDGGPVSALEILRKRYASGEISKEEFEAKQKDLK